MSIVYSQFVLFGCVAVKVGPSVTDTAWGRMSHGTRLLTEGGFEGVYKSTFGMAAGEQLRKTYACYLSTSTGPVAGTLYISNLKYSFCSDRPLSYAPTPGQQAWSYYKVSLIYHLARFCDFPFSFFYLLS